ncbi:MAG: GMC family oxidoreductase N-terminal domain-containing protein [Pseudomonadota bacterium]|nr:GMC family oxidoreductase N-terminal domain-containing protein [Pseudomonadota bacterium]
MAVIDKADYIIVGAGSAGCVLAAELSSNPANRVLVIESGPMDRSFLIDMPRGIGKLLAPGNPHVWAYEIDKGGNRGKETWLKGRAIGGSSSINGMVYSRGFAYNYDRWAELGCTGWGWADMLPHFMAHEDHQFGPGPERGVGGPLKVTGHPVAEADADARGLCEAFLAAAEQAGFPRVDDTNSALGGGVGYQPRNIHGGRRQSAAKVFLHPAMARKNLTVIHSTDVLRIVFEGKRAVGVEVQDGAGKRQIRAERELILSAGAIQSPKLLQLSGVGPAERLRALGIPVVHDQPAIGQNLREHYYLSLRFRVKKGSLNHEFQGGRLVLNLLRYLFTRKGPMANAAQELIGYIKTREGLAHPDCQLGAGLYSLENGPKGPVLDAEPGLTVGGYHMHPRSQGELYITSADPAAPPHIVANYLKDPEDQAASIGLVRAIQRVLKQPAISPWIVAELDGDMPMDSDEQILEAYHAHGGTAYHVSGTCRMGSDPASVVDTQARVRGVDGLRVVDTSIFPELIAGNTNAPAMAAGRHVGKMILAGN